MDRFDICEGWHIAACEWGCYGILARLADMGFKPSPVLYKHDMSDPENENLRNAYENADKQMKTHFDLGGSAYDRKLRKES